MKTVLIVDRDLGFVFWLGRALDDAGYEAIPARGVPDAIQLLHELHAVVDLLIVDAALPGAADLVRSLRRSARTIRVMSLVESRDETPASTLRSDAVRPKPEHADEISRLEWVDAIGRVLGCQPRMPSACLI